jgi:hypothetical protein
MYQYSDIITTSLLLGFFHILINYINNFSLNNKLKEKTIWFFLHFVGNMYVVCRSFDTFYMLIMDPINTVLSMGDFVDTRLIVLTLHIYHHLFFKLNNEDLYHHIVFVYIGTLGMHFINTGCCLTIYYLFSSGLPGGIIYLCLVFEDIGYITKLTRLSIAKWLNIWIRSIGLTFCFSCFLIRFFNNDTKTIIDWIALFITFLCSSYNGQHYLDEVICAHTKYTNLKQTL